MIVSDQVIHNTQSGQASQKQDECNIHAIMKTMALLIITTMALWQATYALGDMMYGSSCAQVHELTQSHCVDNREGTLFSSLFSHFLKYRNTIKLKTI